MSHTDRLCTHLRDVVLQESMLKEIPDDATLEQIFKGNRKALGEALLRLHMSVGQGCDVNFEDPNLVSQQTVPQLEQLICNASTPRAA